MAKEATAKHRLIQAGIDTFAEHGFNGTTTRMIANQAGCNLAAIPYYFGGKEGLYLAVFESISEFPAAHLRPHIDAIHAFWGGADRDPETALTLLTRCLGDMVDLFCGHPKVGGHARLIMREQLSPTAAFDILYEKIIAPVVDSISKLIMVITGESDATTAAYQAFMLIGQVIMFRHGREAVVRCLGVEGYSAQEAGEIRRLIIAWTRAALTRDQPLAATTAD
ncbi:MAG: CerR family C-terminal domain-containing protein [Desulfosarcinaceae bacterium]|nr:CerR family C-terminal domain-containing protein [Desulfosarcinaceae bacterium]